jgi:hypothetical protein
MTSNLQPTITLSQKMKILFLSGTMLLFFSVASAQWTNGTPDISNTNTGNVGIGTSTPATKLHVLGQFRSSNFWEPNNGLYVGQAGNTTNTGQRNTIIGSFSGAALTTGYTNTIVGSDIANSLTTGYRNVIIGNMSTAYNLRTAQNMTTGADNTIIGVAAGGNLTTGISNTYVGLGAGAQNSTNSQNTAIGKDAGLSSTGNYNTFVGLSAGYVAHGENNTIIGHKSGSSLIYGESLTFLGASSGITAPDNLVNATAIGFNTQVTASNSLILGNGANVGIGTTAPTTKLHVVGQFRSDNFWEPNITSIFVGRVGSTTMTGGSNTIVGTDIANAMTTGSGNVIMGSYNGGFNLKTAQSLTTGFNNIMIGPGAGGYTTTGYQNVFVGPGAGASVTTGRQNTELGFSAGLSSNGNFNTLVGSSAGQYFNGDYNTIIGQNAGNSVSSGTSVTFIGAGAGNTGTTAGLTNATAIGYNTQVTASNSVILGNGANVGIGTTAPLMRLHVEGSALMSGMSSNLDPNTVGNLPYLANSGKVLIGWNRAAGNGETDFITNQGAGNMGGFAFFNHDNSNAETRLMYLKGNGQLIVGASDLNIGTNRLAVDGGILATAVTVKLTPAWPDFVFNKNYKIPSLAEVKSYIAANGHLPDMPSAAEVEKKGLNLGEINVQLTKKIEELTLYLLEKEKERLEQDRRLNKLEEQIKALTLTIKNNNKL